MKLTDRKWRAFNVTDIFDHIQRGKRLKNADHIPGNWPYVSSSGLNNGVADWIQSTDNSRVFGESISLANSGSVGTAFYEPFEYVASDHITSFHLENGSKLVYLFMATCLEKQKHNFGFNREVNEARLKRLRLMLPVNEQGKPDFKFMADYVRERLSQKRQSCLDYVHDRLAELGTVQSLPAINSVDWTPFALPKLFEFERGREKNMKKLVSGAVPLVSAKKINNGVKAFVGNPHKIITSGNTVTLNNDGDGGAGLAYYQPSDFALDTHVTALHAKQKVSSYALQFIAASLSKQHELFGHGRSISLPRAKHLKVMLPTMSDGTPDYSYMDQYVKNKMNQKYNHYLKYLNASVIGSNKL